MGWDGRLTHREKYAQNSTRPFKGGLAGRPTFGTHQKFKKKNQKIFEKHEKISSSWRSTPPHPDGLTGSTGQESRLVS